MAIFRKSLFALMLLSACLLAGSGNATAHCQMPCGIYDDDARIKQMREDALTIRKAMTEMRKQYAAGTVEGFNQAARWVTVKEDHAQGIQDVASSYFLTQRVKAAPAGESGHATYLAQLQGFHRVLVAAMKCKQQVDTAACDELDAAIDAVAPWYVTTDTPAPAAFSTTIHDHEHDHCHDHDHEHGHDHSHEHVAGS
ncbi:MAG: superoxide dismutase, Ni [Phycisphaerales bacterium]|nr:superoxide dismutase, Ni [Phycisphaerales bacterium]